LGLVLFILIPPSPFVVLLKICHLPIALAVVVARAAVVVVAAAVPVLHIVIVVGAAAACQRGLVIVSAADVDAGSQEDVGDDSAQ